MLILQWNHQIYLNTYRNDIWVFVYPCDTLLPPIRVITIALRSPLNRRFLRSIIDQTDLEVLQKDDNLFVIRIDYVQWLMVVNWVAKYRLFYKHSTNFTVIQLRIFTYLHMYIKYAKRACNARYGI